VRRYLVVFLLMLAACGAPSQPPLRFSEVISSVETDMIGLVDGYVSVSIGDLEAGDTTWALQRLELRMSAPAGSTTVHLPAGSYLLDDTSIAPADDNARSVTLFPDDRLEIIVRIGPEQPLRPGLHLVRFDVPLTAAPENGRPVEGRLAIDIRHRVHDPARRQQTQAFCDEVIGLFGNPYSRLPFEEQVESIMASATLHLTEAQATEVSRPALQLLKDIEAFDAGDTHGYNSDALSSVLRELCPGAKLYSVVAAR
jgi:hypothetical protein